MGKGRSNKRIHYPPGSLIYNGPQRDEAVHVRIVHFDEEVFDEHHYTAGDKKMFDQPKGTTTWIHVNGIHETELIGEIGNEFQLHPLLLEDILSTDTLPKVEEFSNCMFVSFNTLSFLNDEPVLGASNVSLVLMEDVVISFQESGEDFNAIIYDRLVQRQGRIRSRKADYLFYRFIDIADEGYKDVLDQLVDEIEHLEDEAIHVTDNSIVKQVQIIRRALNRMRRNVTPLRNLVSKLYREPGPFFQQDTIHFLRDLLDDIENIHQRIEIMRENVIHIMDINYTNLSIKTNEVVQVLTIVSTIFIPTTFIAGVYGMNFQHIPELGWKYSYWVFWALVVVIILAMLYIFRKKKWI